jgi:hypothetical protein
MIKLIRIPTESNQTKHALTARFRLLAVYWTRGDERQGASLWPAFRKVDFLRAIHAYQRATHRFKPG